MLELRTWSVKIIVAGRDFGLAVVVARTKKQAMLLLGLHLNDQYGILRPDVDLRFHSLEDYLDPLVDRPTVITSFVRRLEPTEPSRN